MDITATAAPLRRPALERPTVAGVPDTRLATSYMLPKAAWWIGLQAGYYQEERQWHGDDRRLVDGLNGTEAAHRPWGVGLAVGRTYRSGWGVSSGAEYISAQYAFEHNDRVISRNEMVNSYLVTLDTAIVGLFVDTVVVVDEQQRTTEAINRYSIARIPLELSYHKGAGRWRYGVQAGLAAEFLRMRSGLTLSDAEGEDGSTYSVPVSHAPSALRTATLLSASIGIDLGYSLTEHLGLWVTPVYTRGWTPLGDHALYALPERTGIRLRLSYTLPARP